MACTLYQKSCVRSYNNASQAFTEEPTTLTLEGTPVVATGCSLKLNPASITVNNSGLYHISADVTFIPDAAGTAVVQLYKDGAPLPCAISETTVDANSTYTTHIETDLCIKTCCAVQPVFSIQISGVSGTVSHICAGAVRLA